MFGAVSASLIMDVARSKGVYYQLELDLGTPIWVFVDPKYLTSEAKGYSTYNERGSRNGMFTHVDHPYFTETREWLHNNGWIKMETGYWNGDRVIKPFYFNNVLLNAGEKFACAGAMGYGRFVENYNDGEPDYSLKNYIEDEDFDMYVPSDKLHWTEGW